MTDTNLSETQIEKAAEAKQNTGRELWRETRGMILKRHIEKMSWLGYRRVNDLYERVEP